MKKIILAISFAVVVTCVWALTPREIFVDAPRQVIAAIDSITRLDMLDYYASGSSVASRNAFGGESRVTLLTDDFITVSTSSSSEVTMALLPGRRDTMLLVVNTLALPAPDSRASVYGRDWALCDRKLQLPDHNDLSLWLDRDSGPRRQELENMIPFVPAIYTYKDGILTVTNTLSRLIPADDYRVVKPYIRSSISYRWAGNRWSLIK